MRKVYREAYDCSSFLSLSNKYTNEKSIKLMQTGTLAQLYFNVSQGIWQWTDMISFQQYSHFVYIWREWKTNSFIQYLYFSLCENRRTLQNVVYMYLFCWSKCPTAPKVIICVFESVCKRLWMRCGKEGAHTH